MFHMMLATHPPPSEYFPDIDSDVDLDVNLGVFHTIPLLGHHHTQTLDFSTITPPYKRARPHDWSWSRAATADVQHALSAAAATSFPCAPLTFLPDYPIHVEANEDGCENQQTDCFLPNASVSAPGRDMPPKRTALSSDAGKRKSIDTSVLEDSRSTKLSSSKSNNSSRGVSSRRPPVPGENRPRLAATWRETTSSRGADNSYSVRSQVKANDVTASMSNVSSSEVATDGLESRDDYDLISGDSLSAWELEAWELDAIEEQQALYSTQHLPHSDSETSHNITDLRSYNDHSSIEPEYDFSHFQTHQFLNTRSDMSINDLFQAAEFESYDMEFTSVPSEANLASNNLASMSTSSSNPFEDCVPSTIRPEYTLHMNDGWVDFPLLVNFNPSTITQATNTDRSPPWFSERSSVPAQARAYADTSDTSMERENMHLETFGTQWPFPLPENNGHFSMGSPSQNIIDDVDFPDSSAFDPLRAPSEDWTDPGRTNELHFPQTGGSTSSLARRHRKFGRWPSKKMYYTHGAVERRLPFRRPGFPSPSLGSSEVKTGCSPFLSMEGPLESRTDLHSNDEINETTELSEMRYGSAESEGSELFDRSTSNDLSRRKQILPDVSTKSHPRASSRFSAKVSNLTNSTNNHSPVLVLVEDTNDTQQEVQEFLAKANQQSRSQKTRSLSYSSSRKVATTWEHTFVVQNEFTEASESPPERVSQKLGRRSRPLTEGIRERARVMRKIGCCLRCRISKIACTPGEICEPCLKVQSLFPGRICNRAHLTDYLNLFLPEQAVRPFQKASIEQFMATKISGFSDSRFTVYLSSGLCYPSISVTVQPFCTKDKSFLFCKSIMTDSTSKKSVFSESYSPPLSITDFNQDLRSKLSDHIRDIVEGKRNYGEVLYGNTSQLTWDVYEAVRLYYCANPTNQLLRKLLTLYAMQFFMTKSIVLLQDKSENVLKHLPGPIQLDSQNPDLRLINIQLKHVMYSLIRETYVEVLEELEKDLRPKEPALWAPTFCCILILCMCAEMVQITSDFRVVNALDDMSKSTDGLDKNGNSASREDSIDVCRKLDDLPLASAESSFHLIYKTIKLKDGLKREQGFNPIRNRLDTVRKAKLDQDVEDFVGRIHAVVANHRNELKHEATISSFNSSPNIIEDHKIFRMHNSGRLVSAFIQSML